LLANFHIADGNGTAVVVDAPAVFLNAIDALSISADIIYTSISRFTFSRQGPLEHWATPILYTFSAVQEVSSKTIDSMYNMVRAYEFCICVAIILVAKINKNRKNTKYVVKKIIRRHSHEQRRMMLNLKNYYLTN
jgi:hypothetical protein